MKSVGIYSVANIINSSIPFLLLPVLTVAFLPSEYGYLTVFQLFIVLSLPFIALNIHGLFLIKFSRFTESEFSEFVSTAVWLPIIAFVLLMAVFWLVSDLIALSFGDMGCFIYFIPLAAFSQVTPLFVAVLFQAKQEPLKYGIFKIALTIGIFTFSLLFVFEMELGWKGIVYALFVINLIFTLIGLIILLRMRVLKLCFSRSYAEEALRFGLPLIPYAVLSVLVPMVDRLILMEVKGASTVGIYGVAYQVSGAVLIMMTSINQAWAPYLFNMLNGAPSIEVKKTIVALSYKIIAVMLFIYVSFIMIYPFLYTLFIDSKYHTGLNLVPVIGLAFLFQGFYFVVTNYIFYVKKTVYLSYIMIAVFLVVTLLNLIFVPVYGMYASAYILSMGYFLLFIITWFVANKVYKMPWF